MQFSHTDVQTLDMVLLVGMSISCCCGAAMAASISCYCSDIATFTANHSAWNRQWNGIFRQCLCSNLHPFRSNNSELSTFMHYAAYCSINMCFAYRLQQALMDGTVLWMRSCIEEWFLTLDCLHTVIVKGPVVVLSGGSTSPIVSTSLFYVLLIRREDLQSSHCAVYVATVGRRKCLSSSSFAL